MAKRNFKAEYYVGLNDKDKKVQLYETSTCIKIIKGCLRHHGEYNFTLSKAEGCYKSEDETTIKIELFNDRLTSDCLIELEEVLNQECIAEVVTDCIINFV